MRASPSATAPNPAAQIAQMANPLRLEARKGYRDSAVIRVGLAAYAADWARRCRLPGADQVARALAGYREAGTEKRREMVTQALELLEKMGDRQPATGNRQPATGDRQPATGNRQPATGNRQPGVESGGRGGRPPEAGHQSSHSDPLAHCHSECSEESRSGAQDKLREESSLRSPPWDDPPEAPSRSAEKTWLSKLAKLGIATRRDLLFHFPREYAPLRRLDQAQSGERAAFLVEANERRFEELPGRGRFRTTKYVLDVEDETGRASVVSFANTPRGRRGQTGWSPLTLNYRPGARLLVEGTVKRWGSVIEIQYLEAQTIRAADWEHVRPGRLVPIYPLTEGVYQNQLRGVIRELLPEAGRMPDPLPEALRRARRLPDLARSLQEIHWPTSEPARQAARRRLVFEEFFLLQLAVAARRKAIHQQQGIAMRVEPEMIAPLRRILPFELTAAQKRVIREICADLISPRSMNRLIQGDVGSGKTVVAVTALLVAVSNGYQGAMMAPTEVLAEQHYLSLHRMLDPLGIRVELLIGSMPAAAKRRAQQVIAAGQVQVTVGTHALIQEAVEFHRLGLAVVDEQHRFGVVQRAALRQKGVNPELLVMTATPIPRTLALTVYGDLDVSVIDEMPPGRSPVKTVWHSTARQHETYQFIRDQVAQGRQAYVVCPLIEESEKLQAEAATRLAEELQREAFPDLRVGLLHGRMKTREKEGVMEDFRQGRIHVLTSTTVVEVGVDVPNATVMLILNAERFGLAQLHQLRGRVGRGGHQSYCILLTEPRYNPGFRSLGNDGSADGRDRMRIITQLQDGFAIAEEDLRLRGPGEFYGTRQHGLPDLKLARVIEDVDLLQESREAAFALLEEDPQLSRPQHALLHQQVAAVRSKVEAGG